MKLGVSQMADWAKIALKTGLIAVVMVALWAVFTQVQIPTIDFSVVFSGAGTALAVLNYWFPVFSVVWNTTLVLVGVIIALWVFRFAMIAVRWLFKVNE